METLEIFPTRLIIGSCPMLKHFSEDLVDYLYDFSSKHESVSMSNIGGWQSNSFMYREESFKPFRNWMWNTLEPYVSRVMQQIEEYSDNRPNLELYNVWFNINGTDSVNLTHTHPHSLYSGVLWIKTPEDCGNLVLIDPSHHNVAGTVPTEYEFQPVEGNIVLFPSHVPHYVKPNNSDEDRISVSFNIVLN